VLRIRGGETAIKKAPPQRRGDAQRKAEKAKIWMAKI
jgi:hypothetical protein